MVQDELLEPENLKSVFHQERNSARELKSLGGSHPTRSAAARWGGNPALFTQGFLVVPNRFLHQYALLRLTGGEALFVLQLMSFKWDSALPFPSYKTIAKRMGITDKMVRRYAQSLDRKGFLRRQFQEKATNRFDLTGLFEALSEVRPQDDDDSTLTSRGTRQNRLSRSITWQKGVKADALGTGSV